MKEGRKEGRKEGSFYRERSNVEIVLKRIKDLLRIIRDRTTKAIQPSTKNDNGITYKKPDKPLSPAFMDEKSIQYFQLKETETDTSRIRVTEKEAEILNWK